MKITITLEDGDANMTSSNAFVLVELAQEWAKKEIQHFSEQSKNNIGFHIEFIPGPIGNTTPKITAIKLIRQYMEIGLKEAKDLVESNSPFIKPLKSDQLYEAARDFEKFGCKIKMHNQEEYQNWSATFDVINS